MPKILSFLLPLCICIVLSGPSAHAQESEKGLSPHDRSAQSLSLSALVGQFLLANDRAETDQLLEQVLAHPKATLDSVTGAIRAGQTYGQEPLGEQPGLPVRVRGHMQSYSLYVPPSYSPNRPFPLVVCLHGLGFTGDSYLERWQPRLGDAYILACPTYSEAGWYNRFGEDLVFATINSVKTRYRIDPDRIYLTGMSNGGIGAWIIGMHHAPKFAGVAPMASGIDDVMYPFLENLSQTPIYIIHGARDQIMPVWMSRKITNELDDLDIAYTYREHDRSHSHAGGHFFPREELPALVSWFGAQKRNPFPQKLVLVRDASHLTDFGWVRIDATDRIAAFQDNLMDSRGEYIKQRIYARLEVEFVRANRLEVRTNRVRRYTVFLSDHLVDLTKPVTVVTNGHVSFNGLVQSSLETLLREARRRQDPEMLFPARLTIDVEQ